MYLFGAVFLCCLTFPGHFSSPHWAVSAVSVLLTFAHLRVSVFLGLTASASLLFKAVGLGGGGRERNLGAMCVCECVGSVSTVDPFILHTSCRRRHNTQSSRAGDRQPGEVQVHAQERL